MPETIALLPVIIASYGTTVAAATVLYYGTQLAIAAGVYFISSAVSNLFKKNNAPVIPKPEDGSYNLKQNVPPLSIVYGTVKKGGDYVFLEEENGNVHHVIVWCARRISGFTQHYLHDDAVTVSGSHYVTSQNYNSNVFIKTRNGLDAETAYAEIVSAFPSIWNNNCRGDGLASVYMRCATVAQEDYLDTYPNQMPEHSAIGDGVLLYDPRKDSTQPGGSGTHRYDDPNTWEFSRNLALIRLDHLTKPYGGNLSYEDMYLPDWANAANVCDEDITNRSSGTEKRYHGGLWFRANNDPVEVGRYIDDAGEMVVYQRSNGLIGVHAGEYVTPSVTLDETSIFAIKVDKNKRRSSSVLAVRGRYANTSNDYNTEDAALYGDAYGLIDEGQERTKTFDNPVIQSHNHCQRKQKLIYIRTNAYRVTIVADWSTAKGVRESRFIAVNHPSRGLVNAIIEVISSPQIDLRNMRISFSGIVVSSDLYDFDASTEEGAPGTSIPAYTPAGVPDPSGVVFQIQTEVVSGGSTAAYIYTTWTHVSDVLIYEVEYDRTSGSTGAKSVFSKSGDDFVKSDYLVDGQQYKVRIRAWGGGSKSDWSTYSYVTATADPTAPDPVTGVSATPGTGESQFDWTAPSSSNYSATRIYINTSNDFGTATLKATEAGAIGVADSAIVTGLSAGTHYAWLVAINASGVAATEVATGSFTVS